VSIDVKRTASAFCCTITPFDAQQRLDEGAWRSILGRLREARIGAAIGTASPGEGHALTLDETERLYGIAKEELGGHVAIRAMGAEPRSPEELLRTVRVAESVGLDAMQLYSLDLGHASKPSGPELERYFRTLLEAMTIPAVLSSHHFSGYVIPLDLLAKLLSDYPHLIGLHVTTSDLGYLSRVVDLARGRADVHTGGPLLAPVVLALGGQGFLSTEAMFIPKSAASLISAFDAGDMAGMHLAYQELMRLFSANAWPGGSIRFTKAAMHVLGWEGWHMRSPYLPLPDEDLPRVKAALENAGVPELDELLNQAQTETA
jgi:4-hydroxy-tetrahydrodipicolinate synthase